MIISGLMEDVKEVKGDAVFDHVKEDTGVDSAGDLAESAEDNAKGEDVDADVPLAVENSKEERDDECGADGGDFELTAEFAVEIAAEDELFGDGGDDD